MGVAADSAVAAREQFMHRAITQARRSLAAGGPPVGACLVRDGVVLAEAHNGVVAELDITAHAEIQVLRQACSNLRELELPGSELYVTVEPCQMCYSALTYARVTAIYFGAPISAMQAITGHELPVDPTCMAARGAPQLGGAVLEADCCELLGAWARQREVLRR